MIKFIKNNFVFSVVIFVLLYLIISSFIKIYVPCVFHEVNFYQAFRYNPLLFILFPFFSYLIIDYIYCSIKKKNSLFKRIPQWFWNTLLIITLIYWVLRNIIPYLAPTVV